MKALMDYFRSNCATDNKKNLKLYRKVSDGALVRKGIPLVKALPSDPDKAKKKLLSAIGKSKDNWSHPQVAVKDMDLKALGFKPTRISIPLPGERPGTTSWRGDQGLHAHRMGDVFLVHKDHATPSSVKGFIDHSVNDTKKTLKYLKGALPPVLKPKLKC